MARAGFGDPSVDKWLLLKPEVAPSLLLGGFAVYYLFALLGVLNVLALPACGSFDPGLPVYGPAGYDRVLLPVRAGDNPGKVLRGDGDSRVTGDRDVADLVLQVVHGLDPVHGPLD